MKLSPKTHPFISLKEGSWFKLICGASYQHLPSIRNLALIYTLAGVDCIDVAADKTVINSALEGIKVAQKLPLNGLELPYFPHRDPLLMVSINDGEDPHFRKAYFNPLQCLSNCHQPCQTICPAGAIALDSFDQGVITELCYGCGRCLPVCPANIIETESTFVSVDEVLKWVEILPISALEIHTQEGHLSQFMDTWAKVKPYQEILQLIAISCPLTPTVIDYLQTINKYISPVEIPLIWQTDGRPMSGDIGSGTTHLTIKYAQQAKKANLGGFIQLAGGTNEYTVSKLRQLNLIPAVSGVAYGGKARKIMADILSQLENISHNNRIEEHPKLLYEGVKIAAGLVAPLKLIEVLNPR